MKQKLSGSKEQEFWKDFYQYRQDTYIPESSNEYWEKVHAGSDALEEKYKDEPFGQMAIEVLVAHIRDLDKRSKEMNKHKEEKDENEWSLG